MQSKERVQRILNLEPVDRVAVCESFWGETKGKWVAAGHVRQEENLEDHFDFDLRCCWPLNVMADLDKPETVLEETDETRLVRNGNGAVLRWWKGKAGTPEHVDFLVQDREGWEKHIRPHLVDESQDERRINFEAYRNTRSATAQRQKFFCWSGINVFESMHPMCGHEHMLVGMALDPDWGRDMCEVYADLTLRLQAKLFEREGKPDGIWYYEDMGFKHRPFMSPAMYKDIVWPAHKRTFDYAHSLGLKVIVHSCGFVEPLVPGLIEAGMDCLQAMEVKAGMDLLRLKELYGDRIALCGGLDIRVLESNDIAAVEAMLQEKLPVAMKGSGYILHTDHSIPDRVDYPTYKYFVDRGREIGTY